MGINTAYIFRSDHTQAKLLACVLLGLIFATLIIYACTPTKTRHQRQKNLQAPPAEQKQTILTNALLTILLLMSIIGAF